MRKLRLRELQSFFHCQKVSNRAKVYTQSLCSLHHVSLEVNHATLFPFLFNDIWHLIHWPVVVKLTSQIVIMILKLWFIYSCLGTCQNGGFKTPIPEILILSWDPEVCILPRFPWAPVLKVWSQPAVAASPGNLSVMRPGPHPRPAEFWNSSGRSK